MYLDNDLPGAEEQPSDQWRRGAPSERARELKQVLSQMQQQVRRLSAACDGVSEQAAAVSAPALTKVLAHDAMMESAHAALRAGSPKIPRALPDSLASLKEYVHGLQTSGAVHDTPPRASPQDCSFAGESSQDDYIDARELGQPSPPVLSATSRDFSGFSTPRPSSSEHLRSARLDPRWSVRSALRREEDVANPLLPAPSPCSTAHFGDTGVALRTPSTFKPYAERQVPILPLGSFMTMMDTADSDVCSAPVC